MDAKTLDNKRVAAVCGNEVIIFGGQRANGTRERLGRTIHKHYGAALAFATEFDERERRVAERQVPGSAVPFIGVK